MAFCSPTNLPIKRLLSQARSSWFRKKLHLERRRRPASSVLYHKGANLRRCPPRGLPTIWHPAMLSDGKHWEEVWGAFESKTEVRVFLSPPCLVWAASWAHVGTWPVMAVPTRQPFGKVRLGEFANQLPVCDSEGRMRTGAKNK